MTNLEHSLLQIEKGDGGDRLQTLLEVNDLLKQAEADGLEIDTVLPRVLEVAIQELNATQGSIIVVDADIRPEYIWEIDENQQRHNPTPYLDTILEDGLAGWVIQNQEPVLIPNSMEDERWLPATSDQEILQLPNSVISAPLTTRTRPIGVITLRNNGIGYFDIDDLNLLTAIASQAASTIDNARLFQESRRQTTNLSALVRATARISRSLDIDQVVKVVAEEMANLIRVDSCAISRWNPQDNTITLWTEYHRKPIEISDYWYSAVPLSDYPITEKILQDGSSIQIHPGDKGIPPQEYKWMAEGETQFQTLLMLPLTTKEGAVGLVELLDTNYRIFTKQEITIIQLLANQAGTTIENARLYKETEHQLRVSTLLNRAGKVINSSLDLNQTMQSLLAQMNELLNVDALSIALVDKEKQELVYEVAEGSGSDKIVGLRMPSNKGVCGWVMEHGLPALVPDATKDERFSEHGDERTGIITRAMICAPLHLKGEVLGTVQAINPINGNFTENDLRLLVNLANLASTAIANAQQFARTLAAEERYLGLFEDSIDPIILTDKSGNIIEVNKPSSAFLQYSREELLCMNLKALHPKIDGSKGHSSLVDLDSPEVTVFNSLVLTKNQKKIPVEVHAKRISNSEPGLLQWIYRDISKQVELETMREDLMAMLFHDLQNPLGNILASLDLLHYELPSNSDPVILSILEIAQRSSKRLQTLVHSLLDINRLEAGHPIINREWVEMSLLIREAEEQIRPNLERRKVQLKSNFGSIVPRVFIDNDMVRRVLINLLDNALKFSGDGEIITLDLDYLPETNQVVVSVSDQGNGIPEQFRESIFDKFQRMQENTGPKGLGLGLAFCRLAIEAHGGRIWVDESKDGGAKFNFVLPTSTENY